MRLHTKGRLAVNALVDLVMRQERGPVSLSGISQRLDVSLSYLELIFARLRHAGIVVAVRGPGGGYCLSRPADEISVADIVMALDMPSNAVSADEQKKQRRIYDSNVEWVTRDLWAILDRKIMDHLQSVSLSYVAIGDGSDTMQSPLHPTRESGGPGAVIRDQYAAHAST